MATRGHSPVTLRQQPRARAPTAVVDEADVTSDRRTGLIYNTYLATVIHALEALMLSRQLRALPSAIVVYLSYVTDIQAS